MMKKKIVGIVSAALLSGSLMVALPILGSEDDFNKKNLESLESTIVENNLEIERLEKELTLYENKHKYAEDNKDKGSSPQAAAMAKEYNVVEAKKNMDYTSWKLAETKQSKVLEGVELYYGYNQLLEEISLQQSKLARLERALDAVNKKIDLGTASLNSRATAQSEVTKAENTLQTLLVDKSKKEIALSKLMNYKMDTEFILDDATLKIEEFSVKDIDTDIVNVLNTDGDLLSLEVGKDLTNIKYNVDRSFSSDNGKTAAITLEESLLKYDMDIKDKRLNIEYTVRSQYNTVLNNYDSYKIKSLELDNLKIALESTQKRFELGLETQASLDLAQENVDFAQLNMDKAALTYYISVETYKNLVD